MSNPLLQKLEISDKFVILVQRCQVRHLGLALVKAITRQNSSLVFCTNLPTRLNKSKECRTFYSYLSNPGECLAPSQPRRLCLSTTSLTPSANWN